MKKAIIFLAIGMSLILLLGLAKSDSKPQWIESECYPGYAQGRYWQKVKNYEIIRASDLDKLQKDVKERLNHGWRPMGEISRFENEYCQVMVQ